MNAVTRLNTWVEEHPPPGPFRPGFWRSPIRGPWLTSVFGAVLLVGVPVMFLTGFLSYLAYNPWLPGNDGRHASGVLTFVPFHWPTSPSWGYRATQGLSVRLDMDPDRRPLAYLLPTSRHALAREQRKGMDAERHHALIRPFAG